ncbi:MAG: family 43 glycosylhydrolase, partial [Anaerolineaceae bacterium]|nr:family 43 glycosylhydrolase [Anaerolineaceae bacterium]
NWEDIGIIIPPEPDQPDSPLHPTSCMDRPHIIFNEKTGKYVCWMKIMEDRNSQSMTIMTADDFLGPYTMVRSGYRPHGFDSGDFDLALDEQTGKAYIYFEKVHTEMICAELSDDFTEAVGEFSSYFQHPHPPFVRESPAHFIRNGKHYLFTSGTTGYFPNSSEIAVADDWHGPYRVLGNPHPADRSETSFRSQINEVLRVEGTDLYIAIADRWLPNLLSSRLVTKMIKKGVARHFANEPQEEEKSRKINHKPEKENNSNTAFANYVWLPIRFEGEMPIIDWKSEWRIEDYI